MEYTVRGVYKSDRALNEKINKFLNLNGISRDKNLDYTCAVIGEDKSVIATGSCFKNTLRCLAVDKKYQGCGLLNKIITHLINFEFQRDVSHIFIYTKFDTAKFFEDIGFYEIVSDKDANIAFLENKSDGFKKYLLNLEKSVIKKNKNAAIVMNANPLTLGHLYLIERAAAENDILNIFIVSEEASIMPFEVRKGLIIEGTSHLKNIIYHDTGNYIISNATFPSYFQKDEKDVITGHAVIDIEIFIKIAKMSGINARYAGDEPDSATTGIYNKIMSERLENHDIKFVEIPRLKLNDKIISASKVREMIKSGEIAKIKDLVPPVTYNYFLSDGAKPVIKRIMNAEDVKHY